MAKAINDIPGGRDVVLHLFVHGPVMTRELPSVPARDMLITEGYVDKARGYNYLTRQGVVEAIAMGMDQAKADHHKQVSTREFQPVSRLRKYPQHAVLLARIEPASEELLRAHGPMFPVAWITHGWYDSTAREWRNRAGSVSVIGVTHYAPLPVVTKE